MHDIRHVGKAEAVAKVETSLTGVPFRMSDDQGHHHAKSAAMIMQGQSDQSQLSIMYTRPIRGMSEVPTLDVWEQHHVIFWQVTHLARVSCLSLLIFFNGRI